MTIPHVLEVSGSSPASAWQLPGSGIEGEQSRSTGELVRGMALAGTVASISSCSPFSLMGPHRNLGRAL